jgi:hypothetical protein
MHKWLITAAFSDLEGVNGAIDSAYRAFGESITLFALVFLCVRLVFLVARTFIECSTIGLFFGRFCLYFQIQCFYAKTRRVEHHW